MPVTTLSSREFNQDSGKAKRAAKRGPVVITDRGRPSHVLLSIEEYQRITASKTDNIADALGMTEAADVEFNPPRITEEMYQRIKL